MTMVELNLDTAEDFNVTIPFGEMIDVEFQATDDSGNPLILTGVWTCDIYLRDMKALTLTAGAGFNITCDTLTMHFGYILSKLRIGSYRWKMHKVEGGLSAPIWKGNLMISEP